MASQAETEQLIQRMRLAWKQVEKWLNTTLDDEKFCDEMGRDIRVAMAVFHQDNLTGQDAKARSFAAAYGAGPKTMERVVREGRERRGEKSCQHQPSDGFLYQICATCGEPY